MLDLLAVSRSGAVSGASGVANISQRKTRGGITSVGVVDFVPRAWWRLLTEAVDLSISSAEGLDRDKRHVDMVVGRLGSGPDFPESAEERLFVADWKLMMRTGHTLDMRKLLN